MSSFDFIQSALTKLVDDLPFIQCQYEYRELSFAHLIEIDFLDGYSEDSSLKTRKREISRNFVRQFPLEGILFVTVNTLTQLENVQHVFTGELYRQAQQNWVYTVEAEQELSFVTEDCFSGEEFGTRVNSVRFHYAKGVPASQHQLYYDDKSAVNY